MCGGHSVSGNSCKMLSGDKSRRNWVKLLLNDNWVALKKGQDQDICSLCPVTRIATVICEVLWWVDWTRCMLFAGSLWWDGPQPQEEDIAEWEVALEQVATAAAGCFAMEQASWQHCRETQCSFALVCMFPYFVCFLD